MPPAQLRSVAIAVLIAATTLPAAAQTDAQKAQERYNRYRQQQQDEQNAQNRSAANVRSIEQQIEAFPTELTSEEPLRTFCSSTLRSGTLSPNDRASINAKCSQQLEPILRKKAAEAEKQQQRAIRSTFAKLTSELDQMPASQETMAELKRLANESNYRRPDLDHRAQVEYLNAIQSRMRQIRSEWAEIACGELVVSRINVPANLKGARVIDGLGGVTLTTFLCGALVSAQTVTFNVSGSTADIRIDDFSLRFGIVRYLGGNVQVPMNSPVEGGVVALSLTSAQEKGQNLYIGNPNAFVTNFYSQWSPQLDTYLRQRIP